MSSSRSISPFSYTNNNEEGDTPVVPIALEVNPITGSLITASLWQVVLAATDGLYNDLYNMAQREVSITTTHNEESGEATTPTEETATSTNPNGSSQNQRMSHLSFAQRRHELSWRLASHGKTLTQITALTSAALTTPQHISIANEALQQARTAWVQADEAQDALYFFHAHHLFQVRQAPHDVYGACDTILLSKDRTNEEDTPAGGEWYDLPTDLQLQVDRYHHSNESKWSKEEVRDQWHMSVRHKLLLGEVGSSNYCPWTIHIQGGIVRLTYGQPRLRRGEDDSNVSSSSAAGTTEKKTSDQWVYPMEAVVTVLGTPDHNNTQQEALPWTLVSLTVQVESKTGQSNHQLETSNKQRLDLHRLAALAMKREEARVNEEVSRPLAVLFDVAQTFQLSWQLQVWSAQAQALRKQQSSQSTLLTVTPVQFFEDRTSCLGVVRLSFWKVDDRYGPPAMADIDDLVENSDHSDHVSKVHSSSSDSVSTVSRSIHTPTVTNQLTLSVRAEPQVGIRVSLTGADSLLDSSFLQEQDDHHAAATKATIHDLIEATSNPFSLSASEALLAATRLCVEQKCHAVVRVLSRDEVLPSWMSVALERGSIAVLARVSYYYGKEEEEEKDTNEEPTVLFRMTCDARTGSFVSTFARSHKLLRYMACNHLKAASDGTALRIARMKQQSRQNNSTTNIANNSNNVSFGRRRGGVGVTSGRPVRDAFDGLVRSMNVLGQRTGVGGTWLDKDKNSASLRDRSVQNACKDVRVSLITCCGMSALYGLSTVAMGVATGVEASPDMAGESVEAMEDLPSFLPTPPLTLLLDQRMVETTARTADGEKRQQTHAEQELLGVVCSANDEGLTLYGLDIEVKLDTPSSVPERKSCVLTSWKRIPELDISDDDEVDQQPSSKRRKTEKANNTRATTPARKKTMVEVQNFAAIISSTLELGD